MAGKFKNTRNQWNKSAPYTLQSHPYVERLIGTTRREYLDHLIFWNAKELEKKSNQFKGYCNEERTHSSLSRNIPINAGYKATKKVVSIGQYRWDHLKMGHFSYQLQHNLEIKHDRLNFEIPQKQNKHAALLSVTNAFALS